VPGGSVATLLQKFGPFSLQVVRSYLLQTISGLAYLHENDIMHRDIKGSNLLVNDEGVVKLADFGASKKLSNLQDNLIMSMTVRGTPYFMAPEVFEEKYSAKADIWGIGCVAFQMITGNPPWKDKGFSNPISLFNHIKSHNGPPPINISHDDLVTYQNRRILERFESLVDRCFQKNPSNRPTAHELLEDPFFIEMHEEGDDDASHYRGLFSPGGIFSPGNETNASHDLWRSPETPVSEMSSRLPFSSNSSSGQTQMSPSPLNDSPSALKHSRSRSVSVVQWKTSFLSPPRPQREGRAKGSPSPARSTNQAMSPKPDTSNWPEWARAELRKASPGSASKPSDVANDLSALLGSLALSEDSASVGPNPFARESGGSIASVEKSHLVGLHLLDQSNVTYEI
jgi:serine/threonine protein kinase